MTAYLYRRLLLTVPVIFGILVGVFLLVRVVPGDPVRLMVGFDTKQAEVERIRTSLGLDQPLPVQFVRYLADLAKGDLGRSLRSRRPVAAELADRYVATLQLAVASTVLATAAGVALGVLAAAYRNTLIDHISAVISVIGVSVPSYYLAILLSLLFAVRLHWLPAGGRGTAAHLVLPAITLAAASMALIARLTRSSMVEVLKSDYVRTARAKGVSETRVILRHALRNALLPIMTAIALEFGFVLGGAILVETVFAYPGIGWLMVDAIGSRDFPLIQGGVIVVSLTFVLINLVNDLAYVLADPRVRY